MSGAAFRIRVLRSEDAESVLRLNAAATPAVFAFDAFELARLMAMSGLHLAVTAPEGGLVGYALAFSHDQPYDGEEFLALGRSIGVPFHYIDQIVVDPHARAAGLGRMLYERLAEHATARGANVLCCEVNLSPPNPVSLAFHQRIGFNRLDDMATVDGRTVALLRKDLPARD